MWSPAPLPRTLAAALRDLGDARAKVRASALNDLARHAVASPHAVADAALGCLGDESGEVRAHAAAVLGATARLADVPRLLGAADDPHPLVRQMVIEALGEIGGSDADAAISRALSDARPDVRFQAVMVASRWPTDDDALPAILAAVDDDDASIRHIALRLGEERWQDTHFPLALVDAARARLDDPSPEVRVASAILLAEAGEDDGAAVLLAVVDDRLSSREIDDVRAAIEHAGRVVGAAATPGLERRAFGAGRYFRERHPWSAIISLAAQGHRRAVSELERALGSLSRGKRELGVAAVGAARVAALRGVLERLRAEDKVDAALADEALRKLDRLHSPPR